MIVYYYDESKNPGNQKRALIGVPLRDLTDADMAEMAPHTRASVEACDLYRKTKPPGAATEQAAKPKTKAKSKTKAAPVETVKSTKDDQTFTVADEPAAIPEKAEAS